MSLGIGCEERYRQKQQCYGYCGELSAHLQPEQFLEVLLHVEGNKAESTPKGKVRLGGIAGVGATIRCVEFCSIRSRAACGAASTGRGMEVD
jgi:hypothetical protein